MFTVKQNQSIRTATIQKKWKKLNSEALSVHRSHDHVSRIGGNRGMDNLSATQQGCSV